MRTRLVIYMLIMSLTLLLLLSSLLYLFGQFQTPRAQLVERLSTQSAALEKELVTHRNELSMLSTYLSEDAADIISQSLRRNSVDFDALRSDEAQLTALQDELIEPLRQYLLQADCSGAFIVLDTSVSSAADSSRSGIYLQVNGYETDRREMILYRGSSAVAKKHGIMPHRQWRLELDCDELPMWSSLIGGRNTQLFEDCHFTEVLTLPGTSEHAALVLLPIRGENGRSLGVCGFEISESYFKRTHRQPTTLEHFTGLMSVTDEDDGNITTYLACGSDDGYFNLPVGALSVSDWADGLCELSDSKTTYLGAMRQYNNELTGDSFVSVAMIPREDYEHEAFVNGLKNAVIIVLLALLTVVFCIYCSRRYLSPVLHAIDQIKRADHKALHSELSEINDLFDFLSEQDSNRQSTIIALEQEMTTAQQQLSQLRLEQDAVSEKLDKAQLQIARLTVPGGGTDIDEAEYNHFVRSIQKLTPREREIFDLYLSGKSGVEIRELLGITENTLKYHNRNIYSTLNVRSKKQLLRYAAILEERENDTQACDVDAGIQAESNNPSQD